MKINTADSVDEALHEGLWWLHVSGVRKSSRNGPVISSPCPVVTVYTDPMNRVIQWDKRDANPFFHFFEALWMLAGRDDVAFPSKFAKQILEYSDGVKLHGAYGHRWRVHFNIDQISYVIVELRRHPISRRAVISMWDPLEDSKAALDDGKDIPCNTAIYFSINPEINVLDMTVCCRSNDAVWGAHGANVVHFSVLQEYIARRLRVGVGYFRQFSNDYHIYIENPVVARLHAPSLGAPLALPTLINRAHYPLMATEDSADWVIDLNKLIDNWGEVYCDQFHTKFFSAVACPLCQSHICHKNGDRTGAFYAASLCEAEDWKMAATEWLKRRYSNEPGNS